MFRELVGDTQLCGASNRLAGRDAMQKDQNRLERQAHVNLMKCNKAMLKVLHLAWNNHKHKYIMDNEWIESNSVENNLRVLVN